MKTVNFSIKLMSKSIELVLSYNTYNFTVDQENEGQLMEGYFTFSYDKNNQVVCTRAVNQVSLFYDELKAEVIKTLKKDKEFQKELKNVLYKRYQARYMND